MISLEFRCAVTNEIVKVEYDQIKESNKTFRNIIIEILSKLQHNKTIPKNISNITISFVYLGEFLNNEELISDWLDRMAMERVMIIINRLIPKIRWYQNS